jgi:hypothetical protein
MAKTIRPSIIAQRSYSMLTGRPKAQKVLVGIPHGQRPVMFGNRLGAAYFTMEDIERNAKKREEQAKTFLINAINDLR